MGFPLREHILKVVFTFFDYHSEVHAMYTLGSHDSAYHISTRSRLLSTRLVYIRWACRPLWIDLSIKAQCKIGFVQAQCCSAQRTILECAVHYRCGSHMIQKTICHWSTTVRCFNTDIFVLQVFHRESGALILFPRITLYTSHLWLSMHLSSFTSCCSIYLVTFQNI